MRVRAVQHEQRGSGRSPVAALRSNAIQRERPVHAQHHRVAGGEARHLVRERQEPAEGRGRVAAPGARVF